jgi:hydrogenase-1 operon protein HyaF
VLAGVWRVRGTGERRGDRWDIGAFPAGFIAAAFGRARGEVTIPERTFDGLFNAPALIAEINAHIPGTATRTDPHVINLSLLPHTEGDLLFLEEALGKGDLIILSRGYGNCRIRSTGTRHNWWVRYFNSQDTLILNTIEISACPPWRRPRPKTLPTAPNGWPKSWTPIGDGTALLRRLVRRRYGQDRPRYAAGMQNLLAYL